MLLQRLPGPEQAWFVFSIHVIPPPLCGSPLHVFPLFPSSLRPFAGALACLPFVPFVPSPLCGSPRTLPFVPFTPRWKPSHAFPLFPSSLRPFVGTPRTPSLRPFCGSPSHAFPSPPLRKPFCVYSFPLPLMRKTSHNTVDFTRPTIPL